MARGSDVNEAYKGGKKMSLIDFWRSYENREDLGAWPSHTPCQSERLAGRMQAVVQLRAPNHPEMWFITATLRRARILCQMSFFFPVHPFLSILSNFHCPTSTVQAPTFGRAEVGHWPPATAPESHAALRVAGRPLTRAGRPSPPLGLRPWCARCMARWRPPRPPPLSPRCS